MLRRTPSLQWQSTQLGPMLVFNRTRNKDLAKISIFLKERKKYMRYHGSYHHRMPDRNMTYAQFGGPRGSILLVRRAVSYPQYATHHHKFGRRYEIREVRKFQPIFDAATAGGLYTFELWNGSIMSTSNYYDTCFKFMKFESKDMAVNFAESWGMKHAVLDEITSPSVEDLTYVKHKLYAHNFPYLPDPIIGAHIGDPDWTWKGDDKIDYSNYGAKTKSIYNRFRPSLFEPLRRFIPPPVPSGATPSKAKAAAAAA